MRLARDEAGASAAEFALVAPLLLFSILGLFDLGRLALQADALDTAVNRASRVAIVSSAEAASPADEASLMALVIQHAAPIGATPEVSVSWGGEGNVVGETVTITATQATQYFSPFLSLVAPAETRARVSRVIVN